MKFGEYIKAQRESKGITQTKAAHMFGISLSYLSELERGNRSAPSNSTVEKMAAMLELNQKERFLLYDLAAESKQPPAIADDLISYIYENPVIRDILRYSLECKMEEKDWNKIFAFVKKHYFY